MLRTRLISVAAAVTLLAMVQIPTQADYSITAAQSAYVVTPGQTIQINLDLTGTPVAGTTTVPDLQSFYAEFRLTQNGAIVTPSAQFAGKPNQYDGYLDTNPASIFAGDNSDVAIGQPTNTPKIPSRAAIFNDNVSGAPTDLLLHDSSNDVAWFVPTNSLLGVLTITAPTSITSAQTFSLDLINQGNTFFSDSNGDNLNPSFEGGTSVTILVQGVPEPASLVLIGIGLSSTLLVRNLKEWRTRRSKLASI